MVHDASLRDQIVQLTCDLIAIPSTADRPEQLQAAIDYAERYARNTPDTYVQRHERAGKPSLVVTLRGTRSPAVMLNAHLDVVPARPEQFQPHVRDGRIYGRASQDMKGSGAVLLRLIRDLAALPEPPDVGFMFVSDEEIGGESGTAELLRAGWSCGFFLAAEPTDLDICFAQKGAMWVEIHLPGQPAHGSRPWDGRNAFAALREGLVAMERRYPTPEEAAWLTTVVPTVIHGGEAGNRLPESLVLTLDIRHIPEERPEQILAALEACYPQGEVRLLRSGVPLASDPHDAQIARLAEHTSTVIGRTPRLYREHYASDARFYSNAGIPAVCFGPVGAGLHSDEEWVEIDSLLHLYQVLRRFVTE
ncbi:MAG TPA: M20/M25/M40 family metallo-hydrolase [Roseiflexaceae bacterium]|nr:M20/M25/M40 family metallo-hydrolase [Roseiflexaceae bacterium]